MLSSVLEAFAAQEPQFANSSLRTANNSKFARKFNKATVPDKRFFCERRHANLLSFLASKHRNCHTNTLSRIQFSSQSPCVQNLSCIWQTGVQFTNSKDPQSTGLHVLRTRVRFTYCEQISTPQNPRFKQCSVNCNRQLKLTH